MHAIMISLLLDKKKQSPTSNEFLQNIKTVYNSLYDKQRNIYVVALLLIALLGVLELIVRRRFYKRKINVIKPN